MEADSDEALAPTSEVPLRVIARAALGNSYVDRISPLVNASPSADLELATQK